jgi:hypothetical protein
MVLMMTTEVSEMARRRSVDHGSTAAGVFEGS